MCFGPEGAKAWITKLTYDIVKGYRDLNDAYSAVRAVNVEINALSIKLARSDAKSKPPASSAAMYQEVIDSSNQAKFDKGREENRAHHLPVIPIAPKLSDTRTSFQRFQANKNNFIDQLIESDSIFALNFQEAMERANDEQVFSDLLEHDLSYVAPQKQLPSRPTPSYPQERQSVSDPTCQPCFDTLNGKGCAQDQKKPTRCPYNHKREFLTAYQDKKHLVSNWNPFLSKHLCNPKLDRPPAPTLRLAEEVLEPTVLSEPTVHPPFLKSSAATRRELSFPDYDYTNGSYGREDYPHEH